MSKWYNLYNNKNKVLKIKEKCTINIICII
jgi:hypothetical protein